MGEKMSLIEISAKIEQILMMIIESGGEVTPESFDELELFRGKLEQKGESIAFVIKGVIEGRIDRLKALKEQVCAKLKTEENARDRLRTYLKEAFIASSIFVAFKRIQIPLCADFSSVAVIPRKSTKQDIA